MDIPPDLDYENILEEIRPAQVDMLEQIAQLVQKEIFSGEVYSSQILYVTGSVPFPEAKLRELFDKLGLLFDEDYWEEDDILYDYFFIIVGRENFNKDLLKIPFGQWGKVSERFIYLSQEDFLNFLLFDIKTYYYPGDPRIDQHPGLSYLASLGEFPFAWPKTSAKPGVGEFDNNDLHTEHILKSQYGYTVSKETNLSDKQRQKILDRALQSPDSPLDLQAVVSHIAWLVRTRKNMRTRNFETAISKWERDLAYLKDTYYHKDFLWPSTDASSW